MVRTLLNPLFEQDMMLTVLGICPLLIVTTSMVSGLVVGLICLLTLMITSITISCLRNLIPGEFHLATTLFVVATIVSAIMLGLQVWFYELNSIFGIYLPIIAVNYLVLSMCEEFSLKNNISSSLLHSLNIGVGILLILLLIGTIREISGFGTVLRNIDLLFGEWANNWTIILFGSGQVIKIMKMAPGAFIVLGLLLALNNYIENRASQITT